MLIVLAKLCNQPAMVLSVFCALHNFALNIAIERENNNIKHSQRLSQARLTSARRHFRCTHDWHSVGQEWTSDVADALVRWRILLLIN